MTTTVMTARSRRRHVPPRLGPDTPFLVRLRDETTAEHLLRAAGEGVGDLEVVGVVRDWWDGARYTTRLELRWRRLRWWVVEDDRALVALPARRRRARRLLATRRALDPTPALAPLLVGESHDVGRPRQVEVLAPHDRRVAIARRRRQEVLLSQVPVDGQLALAFDRDEPQLPVPRPSLTRVLIGQDGDWASCAHPDCGGLRLLPIAGSAQAAPEQCPVCRRF